jgi:hypothetical protein
MDIALALEALAERRPRPTARRVVKPENIYDSIDPLLEKISKSGYGSLTASERRALDRASNWLKKSE